MRRGAALASHLEPDEIFELLFLVGGYLCLAGVLNSIGLQSAMPPVHPGPGAEKGAAM